MQQRPPRRTSAQNSIFAKKQTNKQNNYQFVCKVLFVCFYLAELCVRKFFLGKTQKDCRRRAEFWKREQQNGMVRHAPWMVKMHLLCCYSSIIPYHSKTSDWKKHVHRKYGTRVIRIASGLNSKRSKNWNGYLNRQVGVITSYCTSHSNFATNGCIHVHDGRHTIQAHGQYNLRHKSVFTADVSSEKEGSSQTSSFSLFKFSKVWEFHVCLKGKQARVSAFGRAAIHAQLFGLREVRLWRQQWQQGRRPSFDHILTTTCDTRDTKCLTDKHMKSGQPCFGEKK